MPPAGIDRFNFIVADPGLEIVDGAVEVWDATGNPPPWYPPPPAPQSLPVGPVLGGHTAFLDAPVTGMPPPPDHLFKARRVRIELNGGIVGTGMHWTFDRPLTGANANYWIAQVVVGFSGTPRGMPPDFYEPFGLVEIVNDLDQHRQIAMRRGTHINP